jgi:hydroxymethylpyrimidine pyrophosphatase-like HAD family hydrolase
VQYRLIAIDLDGTLLGADQVVSDEDAAAINSVSATGSIVVPCTGRGWCESAPYLKNLAAIARGVYNSGAVVAGISDRHIRNSVAISPLLVKDLVRLLGGMLETVMLYQDASLSGREYLVCGEGDLTEEMRHWFDRNGIRARRPVDPTEDDLQHTLRIRLVAIGEHGFGIEEAVRERFGDRVELHCFAGLPGADRSKARFMVEVFAAGVNKWRGVKWLARQHGIADDLVAVIGDEINDLAMLKHAGLGVAMGNASPPAKAAADRITLSHTENGVAYALQQMLDGHR